MRRHLHAALPSPLPSFAVLALTAALLPALAACGGGEDDGAAGGPAPAPMLGAPCTPGNCPSGSYCQNAGGVFNRLCVAGCNNDPACVAIDQRLPLGCFNGLCALRCTTSEQCPAGTTCAMVGARLACTPTM